jgi:hypothetical protein
VTRDGLRQLHQQVRQSGDALAEEDVVRGQLIARAGCRGPSRLVIEDQLVERAHDVYSGRFEPFC